MESKVVSKRKKDKHDNEYDRREKKMRRNHRTRSRSYEGREDVQRKRKRSRSKSPNVLVKHEKRQDTPNDADAKKKVPERKAKETDMLNTRTGGAYIPPARLRMMQAQITDKSSVAYQRLAWEALKKSIHGHINKINVGNIGIIIKELLKENIVRGRGLLCRSVIQAQAASPTFTNVYAALVAAVNSRFPNIGELLLKRLVIQFKRGFKRNDKPTCISSASFIAHLVNQRVAHEILSLELLTLLVESPTDDSVEVAIAFLKECGQKLTEVSTKGVNAIFEMLRNILHEGQLDKRVQYMIEVMFQVWKDGFKDHPALIEELELVPEEEQFTHLLMLDDATDPQDILNVFKFDEQYEENEQKYKTLSKEILGSDAESGEEDGSEESGSGESEDEEEIEGEQKGMTIIDNTETNLVALRRTIYLTINSSLDFEECAHKLMKMQLKPGQEVELCHMFLDCCAEQRTYEKFYGLLAQRFCNINRIYIGPFEEIFKDSYSTAHRLDTNRLRNVSKFFAHLLFTDSISWEVMECVKLNEEDTTSSSRIYIKILFQELAEYMGLKKLNDRLKDPTLQGAFSGIFPRDNPKNTRFSINFFTSIGLGGLTDELREHLKQMPKNMPAPVTDINVESESSSSSSSSDSSSESSSTDSEEENEKTKKSAEKNNSKKNNNKQQVETSNKDHTDKGQRWGHDGFYETYGENARRHDSRPERYEQNNFTRPRDRKNQQDGERGNRDEYTNRHVIERQNDKRQQEREHEKIREEKKSISERNSTDDSRHGRSYLLSSNRLRREAKGRDHVTEPRKESRTGDRTKDRDQRRDGNCDRDEFGRDKRDIIHKRNEETRGTERNGDDNRSHESNLERDKRDKGEKKSSRPGRDFDSGPCERREKKDNDYSRNESNRDNSNKRDDRVHDRKETKTKEKDINETPQEYDRNKKNNAEELSYTKNKYKDARRDEEESREFEFKCKNKNKDKHSYSSNEEDAQHRKKEGKSKSHRKDIESISKQAKEHIQREGKVRKNKQIKECEGRKKSTKISKRNIREGRDKESSTSESYSSESETEQPSGRYWDSFDIEKPIHRDDEQHKSSRIKVNKNYKKRER